MESYSLKSHIISVNPLSDKSSVDLPNTKINFMSFGNSIYYNSLNRIKDEALSFGIFNNIYIYNDKDLETYEDFWHKHKDFILNNSRGYGYWIWKSYLTLKTLELMNDNDILIYADTGCTLNKYGINRLYEYIEIVKNSKYGILSFQLPFLEKIYTKMDIFEYMSLNNDEYLNSKQLVGGIFILRKCKNTINLINETYNIISNNYNLIDDSKSKLNNYIDFIENRHDQSVFSLIRKKYGTEILNDETYFSDMSHENINKYPILATRKK